MRQLSKKFQIPGVCARQLRAHLAVLEVSKLRLVTAPLVESTRSVFKKKSGFYLACQTPDF